jgi:hypothetical protein
LLGVGVGFGDEVVAGDPLELLTELAVPIGAQAVNRMNSDPMAAMPSALGRVLRLDADCFSARENCFCNVMPPFSAPMRWRVLRP